MKCYPVIIASILCLSSVASAKDTSVPIPHKDREARMPEHKKLRTTPFYDAHKGETWTIGGYMTGAEKQAFQYMFCAMHKGSGNTVNSFTWNGNSFNAVVHFNHDARIFLMTFIIGKSTSSINSAVKKD